jgi:hypothetical protein
MFALRLPKSPRKRIVLFVLGLIAVAWIAQLATELRVELRLRQKGASVWRECGRVTSLTFPDANGFENADMELVIWLGGLRRLDLSDTRADPEGVELVRRIPHLTFLEVRHDQITPELEQELKRDFPYLQLYDRDLEKTR